MHDIQDKNAAPVTSLPPGFQLILAHKFSGAGGSEVSTSFNWVYANICLRVYP